MPKIYQDLAETLRQQIADGVHRPGQRLPGLRSQAQHFGVSISTVVAAYRKLEDAGYLEARSRSGFYVRASQRIPMLESKTTSITAAPQPVTGQAMAMALIKAANNPNIVQLGAAVPDPRYLPTQAVAQALARVARQQRLRVAGYQMPPGAWELRQQIALWLSQTGGSIAADDIVITTGCQEALSLALRAVTRPGDVVAVESPTFYGLLHVLESLELSALEIPSDPRDGIALPALAFALDRWPVAACVLVPNFSNPLGYCMSDDQKRAVVALLTQRGIPLIEDDVYGDLGFENRRPSTCKALLPQADILYCSSFSKTLSPGLRIGFVIATGKRRERIEYLKYVSSIASPTLPQLATAELLESGRYARYLREIRGHYASAVARMRAAVLHYFPDGCRFSQPAGGFVLWIALPENVDSFALAQRALRQGVSIAPGTLFSASGKFKNFIRISCAGHWDAQLERALLTLAKLL